MEYCTLGNRMRGICCQRKDSIFVNNISWLSQIRALLLYQILPCPQNSIFGNTCQLLISSTWLKPHRFNVLSKFHTWGSLLISWLAGTSLGRWLNLAICPDLLLTTPALCLADGFFLAEDLQKGEGVKARGFKY